MGNTRIQAVDTVRAAAILTTGVVATTGLDISAATGCLFLLDFTIGSLTRIDVLTEYSLDGTTWIPKRDTSGVGGITAAVALSATGKYYISDTNVGWRNIRLTVQGVGTVTSSSLTVTATRIPNRG